MLSFTDVIILDTIINGEKRAQYRGGYSRPEPRPTRQPWKPWSWLRLATWVGVGAAAFAMNMRHPDVTAWAFIWMGVCLRLALRFWMLIADSTRLYNEAAERTRKAREANRKANPFELHGPVEHWGYWFGQWLKKRREQRETV